MLSAQYAGAFEQIPTFYFNYTTPVKPFELQLAQMHPELACI
jgi:hypothetical protein